MNFQQYLETIKNAEGPETVYENRDETVNARAVRREDIVNGIDVGRVKTGTKWTELFDNNDKRFMRVLSNTELAITRRYQTTESREADNRWAQCGTIADDLLKDRSGAKLLAMRKRIDEDYENDYVLSYDRVQSLIYADKERSLARQLYAAMQYMWENDPESDLLDNYTEFVKEQRSLILNSGSARFGVSRSSNQMSNLMDDIWVDVTREFINESRWRGVRL